ncbi:LysR family transcriptional regulator [Paracidovorax citrulli]|uniref:Transcriptional regulator, LysR family n=2 Tax=Paracidovorax citrulli TaxID=80869 RepID=A1TQ77_PARC0|nr:LysR family transcriptional regulator [Paracidovorax citrulli]ABM33115.1 transcriptional regulator, LysR family [Paracidovorax citrulli AAC00-1]ATG92937.1 LysR family transcriptional regulator [Paracidovorax citrulli]MVT29003.1 LysR family transcriptional regulator [Paracidovorax citrulli]MVT36691.1 LysR family transcriptional regulator [Paracidovorax citrulli]PVY67346.1 LysR family transcriptional regulator [Paracidovorax citrulli]
MQDLNDMLYFAEVVERGGFAAAGRALGIPKSRLSRRVSELEAQLGVRLLQRTTRKLSLTEIGESYLRHCQAVREAAQAASDAVAEVQTEPRGTVRVSCPVTLAQTVLGELMPIFLERHPQVRVEMQVTNRAVDLVEEGVDVALRVRPNLDDSGSMVVKRLDDVLQVLVASPALLARQGTPATLAELSRLDSMAMSAPDGRTALRLVGPDGREEAVQLTPRYVADDLLTLKFAALAGTGMCWLPDYMCQAELGEGRLVRILPGWSTPRGVVHAVFPSRRGLAPAVRRFLDFLGETVPGHNEVVCRRGGTRTA